MKSNKIKSVVDYGQVISCRLPKSTYTNFEIHCIENNTSMSKVIRVGVLNFISNFELEPNDKTNLHNRGLK